jgi:GDP-4-dehydro-6-deoxy-D-mannose reductase
MPASAGFKTLITGGKGFAGSHLKSLLLSEGFEVTIFDAGEPEQHADDVDSRRYVKGDIRSKESILRTLTDVRPDVIYHLAGIAFVPEAEKDRDRALSVNLSGGLNLFEAVEEAVPDARVVVVSSSEVYGKALAADMPLNEEAPVRPASFYAFTKASLESAAFHAASRGLNIVVLRPFNHIGPRQSDLYVTSAFARQVAEAERGVDPPVIKVGNLEAVRDFTDVQDMMKAYLLAGREPLKKDLYNLCSSRGVKIREVLDRLLDMAHVEIRVEVDRARLRPSDVPVIIGDCTRFSTETGWHASLSLRDSLSRILDYWRARISG